MSKATITKQTVSEVMRELGRRGGQSKSKKKVQAARKNIVRAHKSLQKLFPKN